MRKKIFFELTFIINFLVLVHISISIARERSGSEVVRTNDSPYAKLKSISLTDVTWTSGFWKHYVDKVRSITIPHLYEVMNEADQGKSVHNLEIAAGLKSGEYKGNDWQDAWIYKWIEMAAVTYAVTEDPTLEKKMDRLIGMISKAQEPDGYISTNIQVRKEKRFQDPLKHEWYNMGHLMTAAALHYRLTGKSGFLNIANKVCEYGHEMFKNHNEEMAHFPINPSMIMGAVEMYRETKDPIQLELAKLVIDIRGKYKNGTDNWQDKVPLREEQEVMGHAVWYTYLYAGVADVFMENGDSTLLFALESLWKDLVENKLYLHGGTSAVYRGYGFRRDGNVWKAQEVFESVGLPFQLPNAYGYNETCGQVGNFMWNYRMLNITGDPRFAEVMENELYNGFLASMGQDGKSFFYVNPLRWHGNEQILLSNSSLHRGVPGSENIGTCCPTNFSRTLVELQGMIYSKTKKTFWIHHFGANRYDDGSIVLEQKTDYPWEGSIRIEIEKIPRDHTVKIRIPEWAKSIQVTLNDKTVEQVGTGKYVALTGFVKQKNHIQITMPMKARLISGNPRIEATRNQVAVKRGPILYTLEEKDLPEGILIEEVMISADIELEVWKEQDMLNRYPILRGQGKFFRQPDWTSKLYMDFERPDFREFTLKLIPYFTWANRGVSKMTAWLPVDY